MDSEDTKPQGKVSKPVFSKSPTMKIEQIKVGRRFRRNAAEGLDSLIESIRTVGLLHPPVVTEDGLLVVGQRRLEALKALGKKTTPVRVVRNLEEGLLVAERDENVEREQLTPEEALALAEAIEPALREEAKEHQREGGRTKKKQVGTSHKLKPRGKTRDRKAAATGYSARSLKKIGEILDSCNSELIDEMNQTGKVDRAHKKLKAKAGTLDTRLAEAHDALTRLKPRVKAIVGAVLDSKAEADEGAVARFAKLLAGFGAMGRNLADASGAASKTKKEARS